VALASGIAVTVALRLLALRCDWRLPTPPVGQGETPADEKTS
jgi:uncharacterized membrane protein YeiH